MIVSKRMFTALPTIFHNVMVVHISWFHTAMTRIKQTMDKEGFNKKSKISATGDDAHEEA